MADEGLLVDQAYINSSEHAFSMDGIFRYSYFKPNTGYIASVVKKDGSKLSIVTGNLQIGYIYQIEVTDSGTSQNINLDPNFEENDPIIW